VIPLARHPTVVLRPVVTTALLSVLVVLGTASCRSAAIPGPSPQLVQPGAPGQATRAISADKATDLSPVRATAADVAFMQGMIGHHSQAVEMVAILKAGTSRQDMRMLGLRIEVSQADEIGMMQRWLEARGQPLPSPHAHHGPGAMLMPGMLTPEEMARLAEAKGPELDRLFLQGMIKHHEGALTMVRELFATAGAGQEAEIFAFASDVDADQRMEIDRMRAMLTALTAPAGVRAPDRKGLTR
jgi:uncharacterized protein (DUF305 family)